MWFFLLLLVTTWHTQAKNQNSSWALIVYIIPPTHTANVTLRIYFSRAEFSSSLDLDGENFFPFLSSFLVRNIMRRRVRSANTKNCKTTNTMMFHWHSIHPIQTSLQTRISWTSLQLLMSFLQQFKLACFVCSFLSPPRALHLRFMLSQWHLTTPLRRLSTNDDFSFLFFFFSVLHSYNRCHQTSTVWDTII